MPTKDGRPRRIQIDSDGTVWFAEFKSGARKVAARRILGAGIAARDDEQRAIGNRGPERRDVAGLQNRAADRNADDAGTVLGCQKDALIDADAGVDV